MHNLQKIKLILTDIDTDSSSYPEYIKGFMQSILLVSDNLSIKQQAVLDYYYQFYEEKDLANGMSFDEHLLSERKF